MNVTVSARHMDLTDALRNHVLTGLNKVTNHFDKVLDADQMGGNAKTSHRSTEECV